MSPSPDDVSVLEGPSELIGGLELDGIAVAVKVDREQLYEHDAIPVLASDPSREVAGELEAVEHGEEPPELVTDGGESPRHPYRDTPLPWDDDDEMIRRARIEPGLGGDSADLNDDEGADLDPDAIVAELESIENRGDDS